MRLKQNASEARLVKRGADDSKSGKTRLSAYYNLITNKPVNVHTETLLMKGSDLFWSVARSSSLGHLKDKQTRIDDNTREHERECALKNRISHLRFREYNKGYDLLSNKPRKPPGNLPPSPQECADILLGEQSFRGHI